MHYSPNCDCLSCMEVKRKIEEPEAMASSKITWSGFSVNSPLFIGGNGMCRYEVVARDDKEWRVVVDYASVEIGVSVKRSIDFATIVPVKSATPYLDRVRRAHKTGEDVDTTELQEFLKEFVRSLKSPAPTIHLIFCYNRDTIMLEILLDQTKM